MENLKVDYVSDLHLSYYIRSNNTGYDEAFVKKFVQDNIVPKINSRILVVAGDVSEFTKSAILFLKVCSKYYDKVLYVAGNHEYYISRLLNSNMRKEYNFDSLNKIKEICALTSNDEKVVFLDRNNTDNNGIFDYNGFKIAGDTFWYLPKGLYGWYFYYSCSNDSRLILSSSSKKDKITTLHYSSMNWYNSLPDDLDLIITHVPPINISGNNNSCYYNEVKKFKSNYWIYGHDHIENDFMKSGTRFVSNPWGYESKDFKIKTLILKK